MHKTCESTTGVVHEHKWILPKIRILAAVAEFKKPGEEEFIKGDQFKNIGLKWRPTVLVQYSENKQYTLRLGIMTDQETQVTLRWSLTTDSGFNISPRTRVFEEGTYYTVEVASLSSIVKFEQFLGTLQFMTLRLYSETSIGSRVTTMTYNRVSCWSSWFKTGEFSDVKIIPIPQSNERGASLSKDIEVIRAHKCVLAGSSPVLSTMLKSGFREGKEAEIELPFSAQVIIAALEYMYSGQTEKISLLTTMPLALEMLHLCMMYDLPEPAEICVARIYALFTPENIGMVSHLVNKFRGYGQGGTNESKSADSKSLSSSSASSASVPSSKQPASLSIPSALVQLEQDIEFYIQLHAVKIAKAAIASSTAIYANASLFVPPTPKNEEDVASSTNEKKKRPQSPSADSAPKRLKLTLE